MQTLILCKGCAENCAHHARGYCRNCYHKFIVRKTGDFDKNNPEVYQQFILDIKQKISSAQKRLVKSAIIKQLTESKLKELYCDQKMSMGDISKVYSCSRVYVMMLLKKYNLPIRTKSAARAEAKKKNKNVAFSTINEHFFKNQTPEMAYVLGFIYSDGNISNQLDFFTISQKEPEILYKIRDLMSSEHKIFRRHNQELYTLMIGNKIMINDLLALGLTPNKSLDVKFPVINEDLYGHFIRGYFDGDGSVFFDRKHMKVNFVSGSRVFIANLEDIIRKYTNTGKRPVFNYNNSNGHQLTYQRKDDLIKLYEFMYRPEVLKGGLYLLRKHENFCKIFN